MIRELANHDHDRAARVMRWPLREGLLAYVAVARRQAILEHRHEELYWAIMARELVTRARRPPHPPSILSEPGVGKDVESVELTPDGLRRLRERAIARSRKGNGGVQA